MMMNAVRSSESPQRLARASAKRVRVLHVVLNLEAGGLERLVVELANRTDASRFETHVLALQYPGRGASELHDEVPLHVGPEASSWSMAWPRALAATVREIAPDVVHTHSGVWYKASLAARIAGVSRSIHTDHGRLLPDPRGDRLVDAMAARRTNVVVAVSEPLAAYMRRALLVPAAKLRVVHNGVDADKFVSADDGAAVRAALGISPFTPVIGSIGRLDAIKGYDVMIEAFRLLRARWTHVPAPALVIAGDGPERMRLRALVAALDDDVRRDVHLVGWRTDIGDLLAAFDVFAMSSRSEGTSVSLLEAMSTGLCPLVTDVGGNANVLGEELRGRLVSPDDAAALSEGFADALLHPGARVRDGRRARERVLARFSLDAMVREYEHLYLGGRAS